MDNNGKVVWNMLVCYDTPYLGEKQNYWSKLQDVVQSSKIPWMIIGDLNEIICEEEKVGGRSFWRRKSYLKKFMEETRAIDLGFTGYRYTWDNGHRGTSLIKERLDRAIADTEWIEMYPKSTVVHFPANESNYSPILMRTEEWKACTNRPFRFLEAWTI